SDGYFRATVNLADGIFHYQFKIQIKSWFEQEPEPALHNYDDDDDDDIYKEMIQEEKEEKTEAYVKLSDETRERKKRCEQEATFTEIWYRFVDPYATDVDERGSDVAHKAVGVLIIKNGKRIIELVIYEVHISDFSGGDNDPLARSQFKHVT
ncbi:unnamed protein product, partial [Rotaria sordida]